MDFDIVLTEIGAFGKYQVFLVMAALWSMIPIGCNISAVVFLAYEESSRCLIPAYDDVVKDQLFSNVEMLQFMIPWDSARQVFSPCTKYQHNETVTCTRTNGTLICEPMLLNITQISNQSSPVTTSCSDGYLHDNKTFVESITTEWDLVCENSSLRSLSTSVFCTGMLVGSLIGGSIADRFGRIPTMVCSTLFNMAVAIACSFSPSFTVFTILRFWIGTAAVTTQIAMSVYTVEIVGKKWRPWIGLQVGVCSGLGYMLLSLLAYLFRQWRTLQLLLGLLFLPFLLVAPFMPESPRFLIAQGKTEKAKEVSRMMAKRNGHKLNENIWKKAATYICTEHHQTYRPSELCRRPTVLIQLLMMSELWFINSLVFFCLSFNAGNWSGNPFLNNFFSGLVECVACLLTVPVINRFGRRSIAIFCLSLAGMLILVLEIVQAFFQPSREIDLVTVVFLLVAKFTISASFNLLFLYTTEMFPTTVRNTALGLSSTGGRLASIISPFLLLLQKDLGWIIPVALGCSLLASAMMTMWCPETKESGMLSTMDDAEDFYRAERRFSRRKSSVPPNNNNEDLNNNEDSSPILDAEMNI